VPAAAREAQASLPEQALDPSRSPGAGCVPLLLGTAPGSRGARAGAPQVALAPLRGVFRTADTGGMRKAAVVPAYNEAGSIGAVVAEIRAADPELEVVVVDDGSTDGTAQLARRAGATVL